MTTTWWFEQYKFILSEFWRSEVWYAFHWIKTKVLPWLCSLRGSGGGNPYYCLFPASVAAFFVFLGLWPFPLTSKPAAWYFQIALLPWSQHLFFFFLTAFGFIFNFFYKWVWAAGGDGERAGGKERKNPKQAPSSEWSLIWGSVSQPRVHDLSWN